VPNVVAVAATPPQPRFNLNLSPASRAINQGQSTSYTVDVASVAGFSDNVTLSLSSTTALNASVSFTPNPVAPGSSSTLSVATTTATASSRPAPGRSTSRTSPASIPADWTTGP
jgi:hypothetical protein